jgi:hypothetical protein
MQVLSSRSKVSGNVAVGLLLLASALGCSDSTSGDDSDTSQEQTRDDVGETRRDASSTRDASRADAGTADDGQTEGSPPDAAKPSGRSDGGRSAGDGGNPSAARSDASREPSESGGGAEGDASVRGDAAPPPSAGTCGASTPNASPFGCKFAWGTNDPVNQLADAPQLGFVTKWVGYEVDKEGNFSSCDGCNWLKTQFASGSSVPVYYGYFIGFFGSKNGFMDQNVNPNGPNLATHGAKLIRDNREKVVDMYAQYAKQSATAYPDKPVVWLLEGDFVQYTYKEQMSALTIDELAELARDITCAIKGNMPKAVVALNHSTWLSDEVTNSLWEAMDRAGVNYDLVWTTGVANNMGLFEAAAKPDAYNNKTARYAYVAQKTKRKIIVDTSFGLSEMADTWATATPETLNMRIADGVIAANVTKPMSNYVAATQMLTQQLEPVCE